MANSFVSTDLAWFCTISSKRHEINDCYDLLRWQSLLRRPDSALLSEGRLEIWICDFDPSTQSLWALLVGIPGDFFLVHVSKIIFSLFLRSSFLQSLQLWCWLEMTAFFDNDKNPFAIFFSHPHTLLPHTEFASAIIKPDHPRRNWSLDSFLFCEQNGAPFFGVING